MDLPKKFLYGAAAYRPTNPPPDEFRKHLTILKRELRFDLLRFRVQWNPIHREPDTFDFCELDQLLDLCEELDLLVFLEVSLQSAPYWLEHEAPDARYVSALGQAIELGPNGSIQIGGYPGLCFHHEPVLQAGERFLRAVAGHFKDRPPVVAYDCWNEPHLEPAWLDTWGSPGEGLFCYCEGTRVAFREWLAARYGDVEKLNAEWGRAYRTWDDVNPPPRLGNYADWLDWARFWYDDLQQHMRRRYGVLRQADPERPVISHAGAVPPFLPRPAAFIHNWKLAEPVDAWGTSFAPLYHNWTLAECAGTVEATRSAARGKPIWINEISGGACHITGFRRTPAPTAGQLHTWNWLSVCYGSKASVHWCYLEERTGPESGAYGLVRAGGKLTERARGAAEAGEILREHSPLFFDYQPRPQVGILYDPDNSALLFAMEGGDELYCHTHIGYYRAVWRSDNFARYVTYDTLEDLAGLSVLIMPMCLTLPERVAAAVTEFVRHGGVLIAEARTGQYDHRGFNRANMPACSLADVVGAVEEEPVYSDPENRPLLNNPDALPWPDPIHAGPVIEFRDPAGASLRAHEYLVPLQCTSGQPVAESMGHCLAVRNAFGEGTAYYIGTYLGVAMHRGDPGAQDLMLSLLARHTSPPVCGRNLRPRLIEAGNEALLAVFNDHRTESRQEDIAVPDPYARAIDIYSNDAITVTKGTVRLTVEAEGVRVLRLKH